MSSQQQGQAWDAFWRLERIWKSNLPIAIKVRLYKCTVLNVLLYESETWTLTESLCEISTLSNLTTFGLCLALVAVTMSLASPYTVKRKPDPCQPRWKDGSSAFLASHFAATILGSYQQTRPVCTIRRKNKVLAGRNVCFCNASQESLREAP